MADVYNILWLIVLAYL